MPRFFRAQLDESFEDATSVRRPDRLGVELDAVRRMGRVFECHDDTVCRLGRDRQFGLLYDERVIAHDVHRQSIEKDAWHRIDP